MGNWFGKRDTKLNYHIATLNLNWDILHIYLVRRDEGGLHLRRRLVSHEVDVGRGDIREASLGKVVTELDSCRECRATDGDRDGRKGV